MSRFAMVTIPRLITNLAAMGGGLAVCMGLSACTQIEKVDGGGPAGAGIPDEVQRAFDDTCNIAGCHNAASQAGALDLSAAASPGIIGGDAIQSDLPLVELGNVQGSFLALKLLPNPPAGAQMPFGGDLQSVDNAIILGWIAGATLPGGGEGGSEGDSTTDDGGQTSEVGSESTGASEIKECSLVVVAPGAPNPFDIGMNAEQIPPDVGEALNENCGCHEVDPDDLIMGAFPYGGMVHFSTIAELRADHMGRPVSEVVLERVESDAVNRMPPPYYCDLGDGSVITDADRQLLIDWLTAGAPDAPNWMP